MKALILSRPGDFGSLETHWPHHPLTLPVLGIPLYLQHAAYLAALGVKEIRILRAGEPILEPRDLELEAQMKKVTGGHEWSMRAWPQGPYPQGKTLPEILQQQRLFQDGEDLLVLSAPLLPLEHLTGPKVPPHFPVSNSRILAPRVLSPDGILAQSDIGTFASLVGALDFFRTQIRLLGTVPPPSASLRGVHTRARLDAPLWLGAGVRIASGAHVGPDCSLAPGVHIGKNARLTRALVLSKCRIGDGAEFSGKIVIGTVVVDPESGTFATMTDKTILRE